MTPFIPVFTVQVIGVQELIALPLGCRFPPTAPMPSKSSLSTTHPIWLSLWCPPSRSYSNLTWKPTVRAHRANRSLPCAVSTLHSHAKAFHPPSSPSISPRFLTASPRTPSPRCISKRPVVKDVTTWTPRCPSLGRCWYLEYRKSAAS